jgi:hypothetical protein
MKRRSNQFSSLQQVSRPQGSPIDVCGLVVMSVETLGEAHSYGWRITARCAAGKQNGMYRHPECRYREELDTGMARHHRGDGGAPSGKQVGIACGEARAHRFAHLNLNARELERQHEHRNEDEADY